jgi:hypothetical protein
MQNIIRLGGLASINTNSCRTIPPRGIGA